MQAKWHSELSFLKNGLWHKDAESRTHGEKKKETGLNSVWGCLVQPTYKL